MWIQGRAFIPSNDALPALVRSPSFPQSQVKAVSPSSITRSFPGSSISCRTRAPGRASSPSSFKEASAASPSIPSDATRYSITASRIRLVSSNGLKTPIPDRRITWVKICVLSTVLRDLQLAVLDPENEKRQRLPNPTPPPPPPAPPSAGTPDSDAWFDFRSNHSHSAPYPA